MISLFAVNENISEGLSEFEKWRITLRLGDHEIQRVQTVFGSTCAKML